MVDSGNPRNMIMGAENAEGDAIDAYSQSRVQRRVSRVTMQMHINCSLAHLKRVGGGPVEIQRRPTGRCTTKMAGRQGWKDAIDLHHLR